jgi:type IV pilus assembly protein PilB
MGIEPFLTASALDCVVSQRLARLLCSQCKEGVLLRAETLSNFDVEGDMEAYQAKGCKRCGFSGYKGRVGLYEAMTVTKEIRELAIERASADRIAAIAIQQGMRTLQQDGIDKVRMGLTSIQEIARITGSAMAAD